MRDVRSLNIDNSYRSANCNVCVRKKPSQLIDYRKLTANKLHKYYEKFKKLKKQGLRFNKVFVGKHDDRDNKSKNNENRSLEKQIINDGFPFKYYSNSTFPIQILLACHPNKHAIVIYNYQGRKVTDKEISSIHFAYMTCQIGVHVPIILGVTDPIMMLVHLYDIKFWIKQVNLDFLGLTMKQLNHEVPKSEHKSYVLCNGLYYPDTRSRLWYYSQLHEVLARYKMQLFMVAETQQQALYLKKKGLKIANS